MWGGRGSGSGGPLSSMGATHMPEAQQHATPILNPAMWVPPGTHPPTPRPPPPPHAPRAGSSAALPPGPSSSRTAPARCASPPGPPAWTSSPPWTRPRSTPSAPRVRQPPKVFCRVAQLLWCGACCTAPCCACPTCAPAAPSRVCPAGQQVCLSLRASMCTKRVPLLSRPTHQSTCRPPWPHGPGSMCCEACYMYAPPLFSYLQTL